MSSLVTQMIVAEKFDLRLDADTQAQVLGQTRAGIFNQLSAGSFPIKTYKESGKRWPITATLPTIWTAAERWLIEKHPEKQICC